MHEKEQFTINTLSGIERTWLTLENSKQNKLQVLT